VSLRAPDRKTLGERITNVRKALPSRTGRKPWMSHDDFAQLLGLGRNGRHQVIRWEAGKEPEEANRLRIAKADPEGHPADYFRLAEEEERAATVADVVRAVEALTVDLSEFRASTDERLTRLETAPTRSSRRRASGEPK
jgi:hypothetical protein